MYTRIVGAALGRDSHGLKAQENIEKPIDDAFDDNDRPERPRKSFFFFNARLVTQAAVTIIRNTRQKLRGGDLYLYQYFALR